MAARKAVIPGILSNRQFHRALHRAAQEMEISDYEVRGRIYARPERRFFYYLQDQTVYRFAGATAREVCKAFLGAGKTTERGLKIADVPGNCRTRSCELESIIFKDQLAVQERKIARRDVEIDFVKGIIRRNTHDWWCECRHSEYDCS
eukprot:286099_1